MTRCCTQAQNEFLQKSIELSGFCVVEKPSIGTTPALSAENGELNLQHPTWPTYCLFADASLNPHFVPLGWTALAPSR